MLAALLSALWGWLKARLFGAKPDLETEEARHEEAIAQEQASIVADRTRPDSSRRLRDGNF